MPLTDFGDISARTKLFRHSLIEEFRLSESDTNSAFEAPRYSSDVFQQDDAVEELLRHKPHSLIKFKIFNRTPGAREEAEEEEDEGFGGLKRRNGRLQRLPRSLPIHVWANWQVNHPVFSSFMIITIMVNSLVLGVQTALDEVEDWRLSQLLDICDHITMVMFVLEIVLKWLANFKMFWRDGWNLFDFFVTAGALIPAILQAMMSSDSNNAEAFANFAKNLRIFRTFRTLKMIAKFRSLRIIVRTIMEALQSLGFVLVLLFLLMYIFAVLAIGLFSDYSNADLDNLQYQSNFEDMMTSFRTLFQLLTLDQWYNMAKEITRVPTINRMVTIGYFVVWVALGAFIFRNIFIGVMVKNFQSISQELSDLDQASKRRARMKRNVEDFQDEMNAKKLNSNREPTSPNSGVQADATRDPDAEGGSARNTEETLFSPKSPTIDTSKIFREENKASEWTKFVQQSLHMFQEQDPGTTLWPRDTLLEYLLTMEKLQENIQENQELQQLATMALFDIVTDGR